MLSPDRVEGVDRTAQVRDDDAATDDEPDVERIGDFLVSPARCHALIESESASNMIRSSRSDDEPWQAAHLAARAYQRQSGTVPARGDLRIESLPRSACQMAGSETSTPQPIRWSAPLTSREPGYSIV